MPLLLLLLLLLRCVLRFVGAVHLDSNKHLPISCIAPGLKR
jgi:hypothetical protein